MKYIKYIAVLSVLFTASSCNDFLDVQPKDAISDTQTIVDKISAETAVRGVYSALANGSYYGTSFQSIGYLSGDNVQWTGSQSQVQEFINKKVNADNSTISGVWNAIYVAINRSNNVLAKVPTVTDPLLTATLKNQYLGEAYFVRALSYFDLARVWGGVPLVTKPTLSPTENVGIKRSTLSETYAQVLSDLEAAEPLLPATTDRYRATKKTVYALKSRFYLYQKNWAKAEEFASKLIVDSTATTGFKLIKPYNSFFANNVRGTQESIFEIFYNGTTEVNGHRGQWQPQTTGGTRQWAPNDTLVSLLNNAAIGGTRSTLVAKDNQNRWYGNLYYRNPGSDPSYIFRIAELFLIRAEARAQQDKIADGLADLNAVRSRASIPLSTAATKDALLLAIENERRVEFALEPHRWFDIVRTGRAADVFKVTDPNRLVLPIPIQQILIDKALVQNPGY